MWLGTTAKPVCKSTLIHRSACRLSIVAGNLWQVVLRQIVLCKGHRRIMSRSSIATKTALLFVHDQQSEPRWKNYEAMFGRPRRIHWKL